MSSEVDHLTETEDSTTGTSPMDEKDPSLEIPGIGTPITIKKDPSGNSTGALLLRNPIHLHAQSIRTRISATTAISMDTSPENARRTKRILRKLIHEVMQEMRKKQQEDASWREPYDMDSLQDPEVSLN